SFNFDIKRILMADNVVTCPFGVKALAERIYQKLNILLVGFIVGVSLFIHKKSCVFLSSFYLQLYNTQTFIGNQLMNKQILQLADAARQPSRIILGLMSGTSMDGLDLALCRITGSGPETGIELLEFDTWPYPPEFAEKLEEVVSVPECR